MFVTHGGKKDLVLGTEPGIESMDFGRLSQKMADLLSHNVSLLSIPCAQVHLTPKLFR